ncbi:hypothetical protein E5E96_18700 [Aeromonas sp. 1805]|uniref:YiiX/YebB-like N1pC/P60 family cysteine hydrolase n=1 Tax=Aeromonas sp. 1805 TaxID=2560028 RepID=UPI00148B2342|nr:YiiX/YebB-like N1pC/P60 family cysteine hydrolase [Aeromonas sp. 1805]QJT19122.1 hypothetical protein E5E96_18700 [Aeromonas sp. 1805]
MSITGMNAGDILLIDNETKCQKINKGGQSIIRRLTPVNTTHVALSLGDGVFIHADYPGGVDLCFFPELIDKSTGDWKVARYKQINDELQGEIKRAGAHHLGKRYSLGFSFKKNEESLFCSQFIDVVYKSVGIDIFNHPGRQFIPLKGETLPVDFENAIKDSVEWGDVTEIYSDAFDKDEYIHLESNYKMQKAMIVCTRRIEEDKYMAIELANVIRQSNSLLPDSPLGDYVDSQCSEMIQDMESDENKLPYEFWRPILKKNI